MKTSCDILMNELEPVIKDLTHLDKLKMSMLIHRFLCEENTKGYKEGMNKAEEIINRIRNT